MRINHNITALNTYNKLTANTSATAKSLEKLSSGLKINRAGDNAAGLAISEKMRGQIRGLDTASTNASDGISLIKTAEGALNETHSILQRMRELAVQSSNDTNTTTDRGELQKEMNQLIEEVDRISAQTEFNTKSLLDGKRSVSGASGALVLHIGANSGQTMKVDINSMAASGLGAAGASGTIASGTTIATLRTKTAAGSGISGNSGISTQTSAESAITVINSAIEMVSAERAKLGAYQNRLEHTINNLGTSSENLSSAESRIRDVDMASEMMEFTKNNILSQAAQSMLAQANQQPQNVLQLLQ
jgi:flagellin